MDVFIDSMKKGDNQLVQEKLFYKWPPMNIIITNPVAHND
jgi:hypothetical protein